METEFIFLLKKSKGFKQETAMVNTKSGDQAAAKIWEMLNFLLFRGEVKNNKFYELVLNK